MTTKKVVVVIPVYKENISKNELMSLIQGETILGRYDICFIAPFRIKNSKLTQGHRTIYFDDSYFVNTVAYSKLLLSGCFYKIFLNYEYMLIYQLDAFVFSDALLEWCNKGYDYIGAPLPAVGDFYAEIGSGVGNGGLSLRKIESCINVLKYKEKIFTHHPVGWMMEYAVKTFISIYMDGFRYPDFFGKLKDWLRSSLII